MQPDLVNNITAPFLTNGVVGAVAVAVSWIALKLWGALERERQEHKTEIAAKDALIKEIYDDRVSEARLGYEFAKDYKSQNDALLIALRGKADK